VSDREDPEEVVTLTHCGELTAAQLLCGRLDAEGLECFIPDQIMAAQTWHLNRAIGGIRVQVRRADLERAKEILQHPGVSEAADLADAGEASLESGRGQPAEQDKDDDGLIGPGDRAAYRAMRVALVSLWLMGLVHPYSLVLSVRALGRKDVTAWGRRRAWIAALVSVVGCAWLALVALRLLTR
jgi:hypothetical protein